MSRTPPPKYTDDAASARLERELPQWSLENSFLVRIYRVHGWKSVLLVANTVGHLAEAAWHHPELILAYGTVTVKLQTHESGGVTDRDFELGKKIEDVIGWQPAKDAGALEGTPQTDPRYAYIKYEVEERER